eukprot:TRINITY_DN4554_c0_g1_i1.p1 TRINITY_DN4554_c0_g1~~TRINITY_DN4554_c0_g1_i1.p1  ORF type:complete len:489 (+),score=113.27 TRINITY_DN4554_c0_g1_i1:368-1834(+)
MMMASNEAIESFRRAQLLKKQQQEQQQNEEPLTINTNNNSPRTLLKSASSPGGSVSPHESFGRTASSPSFSTTEEKGKRLTPAASGGDLRQRSLEMYKSLNNMMSMMNKKDSAEMTQVPVEEIEGFAMDYAFTELDRFGSVSLEEIQVIRKVVDSILLRDVLDSLIVDHKDAIAVQKVKDFIDEGIGAIKKAKEASISGVKASNCRSNSRLGVEAFAFGTQGNRKCMEDQHVILPHINELFGLNGFTQQAFFAVYDGHVGNLAAIYCRMQLHVNIMKELIKRGTTDAEDLNSTIHHAFLKTNEDFNRMAKREGVSAGTTALTALIREDCFYVANAGDSEAVLCKGGQAILLSTSHLPDKDEEKLRIHKAGGTVVWFGTWRVNGVLSVSRGIGDPNLDQVVIADPAIIKCERSSDDEFLILASDGLWNAFKYQEACDFVRETLVVREGDEETLASKKERLGQTLADEAIKRKSSDNVTVVVIFLKGPSS